MSGEYVGLDEGQLKERVEGVVVTQVRQEPHQTLFTSTVRVRSRVRGRAMVTLLRESLGVTLRTNWTLVSLNTGKG